VLVQEDRFRLIDPNGRGYLFTLGHRSGVTAEQLEAWQARRQAVRVGYSGRPDQGAVAHTVQTD
jgi:hypothetical protein